MSRYVLPTLFTKKYVQNRHNRDRLRYLVIGPKNFTSPFWNSLGANIRNGRSSYHFDISSLSKEIKMKVSLARRTKQEWRCKNRRVRTHHSTSRVAVRRLGRILQRIFLPNQEATLVEPFGNGKSRFPGAFFALLVNIRRFISLPDLFSLAPTNCPWVSEDGIDGTKITL